MKITTRLLSTLLVGTLVNLGLTTAGHAQATLTWIARHSLHSRPLSRAI